MYLIHPQAITPPYPHQSMEKLSSAKPAPGASKTGDCCYRPYLQNIFRAQLFLPIPYTTTRV